MKCVQQMAADRPAVCCKLQDTKKKRSRRVDGFHASVPDRVPSEGFCRDVGGSALRAGELSGDVKHPDELRGAPAGKKPAL